MPEGFARRKQSFLIEALNMRFCYLSSQATVPDAEDAGVERRGDAFEHDQMMDALRGALLQARGETAQFDDIAWDDPAADWSSYDAVMIGTTWDYWDRKSEFLAKLEEIDGKTALFNPLSLVEWNLHKSYLRDLETKGARILPTLWLDKADEAAALAAFDDLGSDDLVFKRQVGAGAEGQFRLARGAPVPDMPHPMMVQRFEPAILSEGEQSYIFIDGQFSHALTKHAASGDYRIQSSYGGHEKTLHPDGSDLEAASKILKALDMVPLYARIDMLRASDGGLMLMELEMVEPFLYPLQGPDLGKRVVAALVQQTGKG